MKSYRVILLGVVLLASACAPVVVQGPRPPVAVGIEVGDRPYYTHGAYYVVRGRRWVWISGHWGFRHGHRVWIHGRYALR